MKCVLPISGYHSRNDREWARKSRSIALPNYDETGWRRAWHVEGREIFWAKLFLPAHPGAVDWRRRARERALSTMLEIQAPLPVAQLPRPLDAEGKTLFNSIYGVSTLKKVKRHEIVAAVDGEAVNIYDVNFETPGTFARFHKTLTVVTGASLPADHIIFCTSTVLVFVPALLNPAAK